MYYKRFGWLSVFALGSFCQIYRVTDEALIAETAVWPNFFLMNIFFALKGSKLFIIIHIITKYHNVLIYVRYCIIYATHGHLLLKLNKVYFHVQFIYSASMKNYRYQNFDILENI